MKHCPNCNEELEDNFDICWNCNYSLTAEKVIEFEDVNELKRQIDCLRCNLPMKYAGEYKFHEGPKFGLVGNLFEAFVNRAFFELYFCEKCGKVEFFTPKKAREKEFGTG